MTTTLKMDDKTFKALRNFIYEKSGIYFTDQKKYLMEAKILERIRERGFRDFNEYAYFLMYSKDYKEELKYLFNAITINETSFFRNRPQIDAFYKSILPELITLSDRQTFKTITILSAGCSTGEEPYTLAMVSKEFIETKAKDWRVMIEAGDLSEAALAQAREGIYNSYALRNVPPYYLEKYFVKEGENYRVKDEIKKMVRFYHLNLTDETQMRRITKKDVIFCRNVMIYFDDAVKKKVVNYFYDILKIGGYLIIGHSESLHNITRAFKIVHFPGALAYKKE